MKQKNSAMMSPDQIAWLRGYADRKGGVDRAANLLGLSRAALTRAIAALPIHRGTAALLGQQITEHKQVDAEG
jgi:hypothetical protein